MSALDDIRASLDAAGNAIDRADSQVVLAMDEAQNATQDFSDLGLDGVAATVQAAHDALETAASTLTGAHDACEGASSGLGEIHSRISTSETVTRIGSVVGELDQTAAAVGTAGSNVDDAHNHSQQAEVDSLIDAIGNAADSIDTARQAVTQTKTPGRAVPAAHRGSRAGKPVGAGSAQPPAPPPNLDQQPHLRWPGYPAQRTLSWSDRIHLLYGDELDEDSGGHLYGTNRPNKTEFPPDWDEDKVVDQVQDVADTPEHVALLPNVWLAKGKRDEVTIWVYVRPNGSIATGHPVDGPGVKKNPPRREN